MQDIEHSFNFPKYELIISHGGPIFTCVCVFVQLFVCICPTVFVYLSTGFVYLSTCFVYLSTCSCVCVQMFLCMCPNVCVYVSKCSCVFVQMFLCICPNVFLYVLLCTFVHLTRCGYCRRRFLFPENKKPFPDFGTCPNCKLCVFDRFY